MTRYALLLRGINVGRAHRIPMAELRELLTQEGHGQVATLLQSGNVVLESEQAAGALAHGVEEALERRFGFAVPTVVRSRAEVEEVLARDPLGTVATDPARHVVYFFTDDVPADLEARLQAVDAGDDQYAISGRELYLWCPHGQLESPLAAALAADRVSPTGTARNWRTVGKLAELLRR